jgi:hypothetical protein
MRQFAHHADIKSSSIATLLQSLYQVRLHTIATNPLLRFCGTASGPARAARNGALMQQRPCLTLMQFGTMTRKIHFGCALVNRRFSAQSSQDSPLPLSQQRHMQEAEDRLTNCTPHDTALGHDCSYTGLQLTLTRTGVSRQQWVD